LHPDLIDLQDLWKIDAEMDGLKAEAKGLAQSVEAARAKVVVVEAEIAALGVKIAASAAAERALNTKLIDHASRRDRTRKLIDLGQAPDYAAAVRQFEQSSSMADDAELEILGLMEGREAVEAEKKQRESFLGFLKLQVEEEKKRQAARRPEIEARYKLLEARRVEKHAMVPVHHQGRYRDMRTRNRQPVVNIVGKTCPQCHIDAAPQIYNEVRSGKGLHVCRGCGAWFYEVVEAPPAVEEGEE
jgi:predicted  nucleic acid-binding Zn-ribbon protein